MGITASQTIRPWRHLFAFANNMPPEDSKIVAVDSEWHIFSVYRAVYGIGYPEFPTLETVEPGQVDTLFFPGCTLVSYMPELIRATGAWLSGQGIRWALSDSCCGSPLMSAGLCERAWAMREGLLEQIRHSGIKRVITVCPGCGEELAEVFGEEVEFKPLPELLYERQVPIVRHSTSLTVFDSCHDRTNTRHGKALRALLANSDCVVHEMAHCGRNTLCCGAGGAVSAFSPESAQQRVARLLDEAQETGATTVLSACPTCTYTLAQELLTRERTLENRHYLELVFGERVDWAQIFAQLQGMWFGEYGAWVCQQLL
jgi:Fe-S oxidoreductase